MSNAFTPDDAEQQARALLSAHAELADHGALATRESPGGFLVEASNGASLLIERSTRAAHGSAPVDRQRALGDLAVHVMLGTFIANNMGLVFVLFGVALTRLLVGARATLPLLLPHVVSLAITVWFSVRTVQRLGVFAPSLYADRIAALTEGLARWPAAPGRVQLATQLSKALGLLALFSLATAGLASLAGELADALPFALVAPVYLGMAFSLRTPDHHTVPRSAVQAGGDTGEFVSTALEGIRVLSVSLLVLMCLDSTMLPWLLLGKQAVRGVLWSEIADTVVQLGVIFVVLGAKPSAGRRTAALSLLLGLFGERLLGTPGKLLFSAAFIFISLRRAHLESGVAVMRTVRFELALALGRIAGRLVVGLLVGSAGLSLGEAVGEQIAGLTSASRLEPARSEFADPPPLTPVALAISAALSFAVMMLAAVVHARLLGWWDRVS